MRELLRQMTKAQMRKMGVSKINKRMRYNWRKVIGAYPMDVTTGKEMAKDYHGHKEYHKGSYSKHLFFYNWRFLPVPSSMVKKLRRV